MSVHEKIEGFRAAQPANPFQGEPPLSGRFRMRTNNEFNLSYPYDSMPYKEALMQKARLVEELKGRGAIALVEKQR